MKPREERYDGGPAFPRSGDAWGGHTPDNGMSLRDYFAAHALVWLVHPDTLREFREVARVNDITPEAAFAQSVYDIADAMLAARVKAKL